MQDIVRWCTCAAVRIRDTSLLVYMENSKKLKTQGQDDDMLEKGRVVTERGTQNSQLLICLVQHNISSSQLNENSHGGRHRNRICQTCQSSIVKNRLCGPEPINVEPESVGRRRNGTLIDRWFRRILSNSLESTVMKNSCMSPNDERLFAFYSCAVKQRGCDYIWEGVIK